MSVHALIAGCAGLALSAAEIQFFRDVQPWGLILFKRNVDTPNQVLRLVAQFRECVGRAQAPVLIDQEGGRVQRLARPRWRAYPTAARLARLDDATRFVHLAARLMAQDLAALGITVNCLPVLDVPVSGGHNVIGDRAYGVDAARVALLGRAAAEGLLAGGVLPVIKHIPGHGRATADTHHELPIVLTPRDTLESSDFAAFRACRDLPMAMTAHVVYSAIDASGPATTSAKIIKDIIRDLIGFDGLLMSDDLSMKALSGDFRTRTERSFAAGIDVALHCNGDIDEMREVASATPRLEGRALSRAQAALACRRAPEPFDAVDAAARLDLALAAMA